MVSAWLTSGGFADQSLISRYGFNSIGMRTQLKRLRQLLIDHGKRPIIWINASFGHVAPHTWAFADIVSDGEGIGVEVGSGPDWMDRYNTQKGINWLRGVSRTEKYGWTQEFLNYVRWNGNITTWNAAARTMIGMLQLFDIPVVGIYHSSWSDYMQPRLR